MLADFTNTTGDPVFDGALEVRARRGAGAVAVPQGLSRRAYARDAALMGRPPDERDHAVGRPRDRAARAAEGAAGRLDRRPRHELRARARGGQRRDRRRDGARAGRGPSKEEVLTALGGRAPHACARGSANRSRRFSSSTCRLRGRRPRRSRHCTRTRWRSTTARVEPAAGGDASPAAGDRPRSRFRARPCADGRRCTPTRASTSLAPEFARKAFDLRDRVSERERFFISFRYYRDATQNWAEALALSQSGPTTYPARVVRVQQPGRGAQPLRPVPSRRSTPSRESIRLDPRVYGAYSNLAAASARA